MGYYFWQFSATMEDERWTSWLQNIYFCESILDRTVAPQAPEVGLAANFPCCRCGLAWATEKAYLAHCRKVHKESVQLNSILTIAVSALNVLQTSRSDFASSAISRTRGGRSAAMPSSRSAPGSRQLMCRCGKRGTASVNGVPGNRVPHTLLRPALPLQHKASEWAMSKSDGPHVSPRVRITS